MDFTIIGLESARIMEMSAKNRCSKVGGKVLVRPTLTISKKKKKSGISIKIRNLNPFREYCHGLPQSSGLGAGLVPRGPKWTAL